jgi:hypothetical protein
MSVRAGMVRIMADGRNRSSAKQARRDARRRKARRRESAARETPDEAPLLDEVREALDGGQPLDLLGLVSMMIEATAPKAAALLRKSDEEDPPSLKELVAAFIDLRTPETTALLTVLGEMLIDDDVLRDSCRRAVETRDDSLPRWLAELAQTTVFRAVRMTHILGDGDELLLAVRLADGQELTCAVNIDHLMLSEVADAFFVPNSIDKVLAVAHASNTDPDTSFIDVDLADARAGLQNALDKSFSLSLPEDSATWPSCRALVQWLAQLMPEGGSTFHVPHEDWAGIRELIKRFFASPAGTPFDYFDHRQLLELCIEDGTGDPLRWSAARLRQLRYGSLAFDDDIPVEVQLDLPELLRAFVPFAHAESEIRLELTAEALTAIDEVADHYRAAVLDEAERQGYFDDDDEGPVG